MPSGATAEHSTRRADAATGDLKAISSVTKEAQEGASGHGTSAERSLGSSKGRVKVCPEFTEQLLETTVVELDR